MLFSDLGFVLAAATLMTTASATGFDSYSYSYSYSYDDVFEMRRYELTVDFPVPGNTIITTWDLTGDFSEPGLFSLRVFTRTNTPSFCDPMVLEVYDGAQEVVLSSTDNFATTQPARLSAAALAALGPAGIFGNGTTVIIPAAQLNRDEDRIELKIAPQAVQQDASLLPFALDEAVIKFELGFYERVTPIEAC